MPEERATPDALASDDAELDASLPGEPSDDVDATPTAGGDAGRDLRNRAAQLGREAAEAKRQADEARRVTTRQAQEIQDLREQLGRVTSHLGQEAERRREAYLASLPPDQRMSAELKMLRQEVTSLRARPPAQQAAPTAAQQETRELAQRIIQEYIEDHDLPAGSITLTTPGLDWDSEEDFRSSVRRIARQAKVQAPSRGDQPVASKPAASKNSDKDSIKKEVRAEILAELGINRPVSAKPAASGGSGDTTDAVARLNAGYRSRGNGGMVGHLKKMQALRDEAKAARSF